MWWIFVLACAPEPAMLSGAYELELVSAEEDCGFGQEALAETRGGLVIEELPREDLLVEAPGWANVFVADSEGWQASRLSEHRWEDCHQETTTRWDLRSTELGALRLVESLQVGVSGECAPQGQQCTARVEHLAWPVQ